MKKLLGVLVIVLLIIVGWQWLRQQRMTAPWNEPKWAAIDRGDIRVPITASGLIEPNQKIEVKSKASGDVTAVNVVEGKFVKKGDVLVTLKRIYEERNVARAKAALDRAQSLLATANLDVVKAQSTATRLAAQIDQLKAEGKVATAELERVRDLEASKAVSGGVTPLEQVRAEQGVEVNAAQVKSAEAELRVAENNIAAAEENVKIQQTAVTEAENTHADAQERLLETTIVAPEDSLVTDVDVRVGEVIQGGASTFTGGTVLVRLADVSKMFVLTRVDESDYGRVVEIAPAPTLPQMPGPGATTQPADAPTSRAATQLARDIRERTGIVTLTVDAYPEDKFEGRIERVEPQGNLNPGTSIIQFDVMVEITDRQRHVLPLGAQAQVDFTVESAVGVLRVPAEAAKSHEGERGVWLKVAPPAGSSEKWGKRFVPCRFGITDGAYTHLIETINGEKLDVGMEVFTKVPADEKEKDDGP